MSELEDKILEMRADGNGTGDIASALGTSWNYVEEVESNSKILNTLISEMYFSVRIRNVLSRLSNINTLKDLVGLSQDYLLSCRNFGANSLNEIRYRLSERGLKLKEDATPRGLVKPRDVLSEKIRELAKEGLTIKEIAERLETSYSYVRALKSSEGIEVKRAVRRRPEIDSLIEESKIKTLKGIGDKVRITGEAVRQYMKRNDLYDDWRIYKEIREEDEAASLVAEEKRKNLIGNIVGAVLRRAYENETDWATRKAFEYLSANPRTTYSFDRLEKVFRVYQKAKEKGKKLSLNEIKEKSKAGFWFAGIGKILHRVGLEPMHGSRENRGRLSDEEKKAIKRAGRIKMPVSDLAYFIGLENHNVSQNFLRWHVKRQKVKCAIKPFGLVGLVGGDRKYLPYRLASQIYEARDAGYFREFSRNEMAGFFDTSHEVVGYALAEEDKIAPKISRALKTIFPNRRSAKPYKMKSDRL